MQKSMKKKLVCISLIAFLFAGIIGSSTLAFAYKDIYDDDTKDLVEINEDDFDDFEDSLDEDDSYNDVSKDLNNLFLKGVKRDTPASIDMVKTDVEYIGQPLAPADNVTYFRLRFEFRDKITSEDFIIIALCDADREFILAGVYGDIDFFESTPDDTNQYAGYSEAGSVVEGNMIVSEDRAILYFPTSWLRENEDPEDLNWLFTVFTDYHGKFVGDICPNTDESQMLSMNWAGIFSPLNIIVFAVMGVIVVGIVMVARKFRH